MNVFFKRFYWFILERQEGREKEREGNIDVWEIHRLVASHMPPTQDLACNPGMCPDQGTQWWPFSLQAGTQSTEPHQPGLFKKNFFNRFLGRYQFVVPLIRAFIGCALTGDQTHNFSILGWYFNQLSCQTRESMIAFMLLLTPAAQVLRNDKALALPKPCGLTSWLSWDDTMVSQNIPLWQNNGLLNISML